MKDRLILFLAMLCAVAQGAWAQTRVGTDSELRAAIQTNGANIQLAYDIQLSNSTLSIESGKTVTIDLNGHTLDRKLTKRGEGGGQVITVRKGATLNLSNGTLKGGWGRDGGGLVNEGGTVTLTNVNITGNTADDRGGGISNHGTLTMTGGSITGNTTNDQTDPKGGGGIMNTEGATATLTGVTITGNTVNVTGGGGICNYGTLAVDGCTIQNNKANTEGGGIWTENGKTLNMKGAMTVTDNTIVGSGGMANNLFLRTGALITVTGSLAGSNVGIKMETAGTFTSGYNTHNSGVAPSTIFTPDVSVAMAVSLDGNEAKLASSLPEGVVYYIERSWDVRNKKVVNTTKTLSRQIGYSDVPTAGDYKLVTNSNNDVDWFQLGGYNGDNDEYYVVSGNVSNNTLNVKGKKVHLILLDGAKLTLSGGILSYGDQTLYIYSQSYGSSMGKLDVKSGYKDEAAGIGSDWDGDKTNFKRTAGNLEIHGGKLTVKGGDEAAGIGGGYKQQAGNITIYGGDINATGGEGFGTIKAGAGIGGTHEGGGHLIIYDGKVYAKAYKNSPGIGAGEYVYCDFSTINMPRGGRVDDRVSSNSRIAYTEVEIYGGEVEAHGGENGAGIGGGNYSSGVIVKIFGGDVKAYGGEDGAGIGGGWDNDGGYTIVRGGTVYAKGGGNGAGIGSGTEHSSGVFGGELMVDGGHIEAYGGVDAAGIGGGEDAEGGTVKITGGYVYAEGNDYGPAIGGGQGGDGGNVTITGGTVIAKAGENATGAIGSGDSDDNGTLTLGDDRCVFITSNLWRCKKENRVSDCFGAVYLQISECRHGDATASVINGDKHSISNCKWCYTTGEGTHYFGDDSQCDACQLIRLVDEGDNSALFSKWADNQEHDFVLSGRKLIPNEEGSRAYTVCLPFDMDLTGNDNLTVWTLSYIKDGSEMVFTQTSKKIEAGKPYLIVISQGELELLGHSKLTTTASEGVRVYDFTDREQPLGWWRGTLTKIESADAADMMAYALQKVGDFRRIRHDTPYAWWGAFRSMYCPDELPGTNKFTINRGAFNGLGGQTVTISFEGDAEIDDTTTGITTTNYPDLTNEAGAWYDMLGRRLSDKPTLKGVYLYNGKKLIIK